MKLIQHHHNFGSKELVLDSIERRTSATEGSFWSVFEIYTKSSDAIALFETRVVNFAKEVAQHLPLYAAEYVRQRRAAGLWTLGAPHPYFRSIVLGCIDADFFNWMQVRLFEKLSSNLQIVKNISILISILLYIHVHVMLFQLSFKYLSSVEEA